MSAALTSLCCVGPAGQRRSRAAGVYVPTGMARPNTDSTSENQIRLLDPQHPACLLLLPSISQDAQSLILHCNAVKGMQILSMGLRDNSL